MRIVKVIKHTTYKGKDGKIYNNKNYYVVLNNGKRVAITPTFKDGYKYLDIICDIEDNR